MQVLFVTVDPDRDTKELLANCAPAFDRRFVGLDGDTEATACTATDFKALYQKQPGRPPETCTVDRSAGTFAYDPKGNLRANVGYGQGADVFAHDILVLLKTAG